MALTGKQSIIQAPPVLGIHTREAFRAQAVALLEGISEPGSVVVLDLGPTEYVDTGGLATLAVIHAKAVELGHSLRLRGVNDEVVFALELAKLTHLAEDGSG